MLKWLLGAAVLPALLLMLYTYRMDTVEKESPRLLLKLALLGALACVPASVLEGLWMELLARLPVPCGGAFYYAYYALEAFVVVALSEELCKFVLLRLGSWRHGEFNYHFDGMLYAVFVSLGFAALENILYVFNYGPGVLLSRALLSVPGHMTFGVFMGFFYAQAKLADAYGEDAVRRRLLSLAVWVPCLLHGFYDFCLMAQLRGLALIFILFVVALDIAAVRMMEQQSRRDRPLR